MQITVEDIPVEVVRKRMKQMRLAILPPDGRVRVSAPVGTPQTVIVLFVRSKLNWIRTHQAKLAQLPAPQKNEYVSGETIFLWGKPYILRLDACGRGGTLVLEGDQAVLRIPDGSTLQQREHCVREWYRAQLKEAVARYLPKWEAITGLRCTGWQSKDMKTRWGTCNTESRRIWLNVQLAKKPAACLEYVILHELAHLKVRNHGPAFKAVLDQYMPDWRQRKQLLNDRSPDCPEETV